MLLDSYFSLFATIQLESISSFHFEDGIGERFLAACVCVVCVCFIGILREKLAGMILFN